MVDSDRPLECEGLMFIGDPHLEARVPGFRKDDYPRVAMDKFRWCLEHARNENLQPILLGDLFQLPQDNPNWLLSQIIEVITESTSGPLPAIYGNHDVRENSLKSNDSVNLLFSGGQLRRLSAIDPLQVSVCGRRVVVGGTVWGERLPNEFVCDGDSPELVVWITHHDIFIPGYEESGRIRPRELPGIDLIVNGHIHRRLEPVSKGNTHWITAGNITRRARSDASRQHVPAVVCLRPSPPVGESKAAGKAQGAGKPKAAGEPADPIFRFPILSRLDQDWELIWTPVPHAAFDDVFHGEIESDTLEPDPGSGFVADLRELTARKTESGAGLTEFLNQHLDRFDAPVAKEIMRLHDQVAYTNLEPKQDQDPAT